MDSPPRGQCFPSDPRSRNAAVLGTVWPEERSNSYIHLLPSSLLFTSTHSLLFVLRGSDSKESACSAGDLGSIPGSGRSPGERNGYPLQYPCLENLMDGGAWHVSPSLPIRSPFPPHRHVHMPILCLGVFIPALHSCS